MSRARLSKRQEETLGLAIAFHRIHGSPATAQQVGDMTSPPVSVATAAEHMRRLVERGFMRRDGYHLGFTPIRRPDGRPLIPDED